MTVLRTRIESLSETLSETLGKCLILVEAALREVRLVRLTLRIVCAAVEGWLLVGILLAVEGGVVVRRDGIVKTKATVGIAELIVRRRRGSVSQ